MLRRSHPHLDFRKFFFFINLWSAILLKGTETSLLSESSMIERMEILNVFTWRIFLTIQLPCWKFESWNKLKLCMIYFNFALKIQYSSLILGKLPTSTKTLRARPETKRATGAAPLAKQLKFQIVDNFFFAKRWRQCDRIFENFSFLFAKKQNTQTYPRNKKTTRDLL